MAVLDVPPTVPFVDSVNGRMRNIKSFCDFSLCFAFFDQIADAMHIGFRKLAHRLPFSPWWIISSLAVAVAIVVRFCSKPKVIWVYTNPVVASVQYAKALRNFTPEHYPCDTVSRNSLTPKLPFPVSGICRGSFPRPALIGKTNFRQTQESFFWRRLFGPTVLSAKQALLSVISWHGQCLTK